MTEFPKPESPPEKIILEGVLVKRLRQKGSKSQHTGYVLIKSEDATEILVEHILDDMLKYEHIQTFEDKIVKLKGFMHNGRLLAESIEEIK